MRRVARILGALTPPLIAIGVGLVAGAVGWSHLPVPGFGVVFGVVAGIATGAIVSRLWSSRVGRVLLLLATAGHVAFWSSLGIQAMGARDPAVRSAENDALTWAGPTPFSAGHARVPFILPVDTPLAGWGSGPRRTGLPAFAGFGPLGRLSMQYMAASTATALHRNPLFATVGEAAPSGDPVGASAVVVRAQGQSPFAVVTLDTVTIDQDVFDAIANGLRDLGFLPAGLLVCASHTHSGPGGYSKQPLSQVLGTGHFHEEAFNALVQSAVGAVRSAYEACRPAHVAIVRARDRDASGAVLARNRSNQESVHDGVVGVRFDDTAGKPMALILNHAVHPVVFRRSHPFTERDLAGAIEREIGADLGAPVMFVNGALGDVSPRATPGKKGAARCSALAKQFAQVIAEDVRRAPASSRLHIAAQRRALDLGTPLGVRAWGDRNAIVEASRRPFGGGSFGGWIADLATLPLNAFVWSLGQPDVRLLARFGEGVGISANVSSLVPQTRFFVGAWLLTPGDGTTSLAMLWQPGEATQAVGAAWRKQAAPLCSDVMILGLTNGACTYLTAPAEYRRPSYEARATLFGARATVAVGEQLDLALQGAK